jgi:Zn-dependent peptidase ImmA (M78 family)/transcriptional regulator with XRE-family HTH domain
MVLTHSEIGRRIHTVREELGIPIEALAKACGTAPSAITSLEAGTLDPVPGDYILIASRVLRTDFRYFVSDALDDVEKNTHQVFRALARPQPSDLIAIRRFMTFCMGEQELEALLGVQGPPLPPLYPRPGIAARSHRDQGRGAATMERDRLLLGNQPIPNVFEVLRRQGVRLLRHRMTDAELSGVTVSHPKAGVCVLVNYEDDLYRQFFSAAHEYCHVLFDREEIATNGCIASYRYTNRELAEMRANAFAGEFLLPSGALSKYPRARDISELESLIATIARDYRVNTEPVAIRMKGQGWITDRTLASFQKTRPVVIPRREKTDPDIPRDLSDRQMARLETVIQHGISAYYLELLRRALTEDKITSGRFAELLDMTVEESQEFISSVGMAL